MTGNAGAGMYQPIRAQTGSPRRQDGVTISVCNGTQSARHADSTSIDHADATVRSGSDADSRVDMGDIKGHEEVQEGGYRGSSDGAANIATDRAHQHREQLTNESKDLPELPEPPDNPTQRQTQSLSIELEGERRAASSCNVERTRVEAEASEVQGHNGDNGKQPMKL